jgi:hypothetical protein
MSGKTDTVPIPLAITITQPTAGAQWDFSGTNTIEWTADTNEAKQTFSIGLYDSSSNSQTTIVQSVNGGDLKYSFSNFVAKPGKYQVRFDANSANNTGILAQSSEFNVTKSGVATTSTSGGSTASSTASGAASTSAKSGAVAMGVAKTLGVAGPVLGALFLIL